MEDKSQKEVALRHTQEVFVYIVGLQNSVRVVQGEQIQWSLYYQPQMTFK